MITIPGRGTGLRRLAGHVAAIVAMGTFAAGCSGGSSPDPGCGDDPCLTPPAPICNGSERVTFGLIGECRAGACVYLPTTASCAAGCVDGACTAEACGDACDSPPAATCEGAVSVVWSGGTCDEAAGECVYDELRDDCAAAGEVCEDGVCVAPCADGCATPPAAGCDGDISISYGAGTCVEGACRFPSSTADCAAAGQVCADGECVDRDPCLGVACTTPPEANCESGTLVAWEPAGECRAGECVYFEVRTACAALEEGGRCVAGLCVGPDPCVGVSCTRPPALTCEGDELVRSSRPGTCVEGDCVYVETRTDCSPAGGRCVDGACTGPDPCLGVACDEPPAAECRTNVLVTYDAGYCEAGECVWTQARTDCAVTGERCVRGACVEATAPCDDVCGAPPAPICDGDVLTTFVVPDGECDAAACRFETISTDCGAAGGYCDAGACVAVDPCHGVECTSPPDAACVGDTVYRYQPTGVCVSGSCIYGSTALDCAFDGGVCRGGECDYGAACDGVVCDDLPPSDCEGSVAVRFTAGECRGGVCHYEPSREDCAASDSRCSAGVCVPIDRCIGVECITPPPAFCDAGVAVTWQSPGTCEDGSCSFEPVRTRCADSGRFCNAGACVAADPCLGVACDDPPAAGCDGLLRTSYGGGVCADGACSYPRTTYDCTLDGAVCADNECVGAELCVGVTCDAPPGDTCVAGVARRWRPEGVCRAGSCTYERYEDDCAARGEFCTMGACSPTDPCAAVACDRPPEAAYCDGSVAVSYPIPAACSDGICRYAPQRLDCAARGQRCELGSCVDDDPCAGIECDVPPAPVCVGSEAWVFALPGGCLGGECAFDTTVTDCEAEGLRCAAGACVDPCEGVTCEAPPPRCGPDNSLIVAVDPVCADGACTFDERTETCPDGWYCDGAACVDPCAGVVCDDVDSWCEGDVLARTVAPGTCRGFGECFYDRVEREDCAEGGERCVAGQCYAGDPCDLVTCPARSDASCDRNTRVTIEGEGSCTDGVCSWEAVTAREDCGDQSCLDGECVAAPVPGPGELVITEIAAARGVGAADWVELLSLLPTRADIGGVTVRNATGGVWTVPAGTRIDPGQHLVLSGGPLADADAELVLTGLSLGDVRDTVRVAAGAVTIVSVSYDPAAGWPDASGTTLQLDPSGLLLLQVTQAAFWCRADEGEPVHAAGTPGTDGGVCLVCATASDCPHLDPLCAGDRALVLGEPLCVEGLCELLEGANIEFCPLEGAVCRDGACAAP